MKGPFEHLGDRLPTLTDVSTLIKQGRCSRICIMAGAGISTSAGIPDFRSPGTGLYSNLAKYNLPYPEAIFDIDYFPLNPAAFYTLARELYPGNFAPTTTHYFFTLLRDKGLLKTVFTQNIDTLERIAGLKEDEIIEAHGSFASAECISCQTSYTKESIRPQIERGEIVYCLEKGCKGNKRALVKPRIVFFGEGLPEKFHKRISDLRDCDLLLILGTSLSVQPFAGLLHRVPPHCPRVLINLERVGEAESYPNARGLDFDGRTLVGGGTKGAKGEKGGKGGKTGRDGVRDVLYEGETDEAIWKLVKDLGWEEDLKKLIEKGKKELSGSGGAGEVEETLEKIEKAEEGSIGKKSEDELVRGVEKLGLEEVKEERVKDGKDEGKL